MSHPTPEPPEGSTEPFAEGWNAFYQGVARVLVDLPFPVDWAAGWDAASMADAGAPSEITGEGS
jgi:hypothetical protein